MTVPRSGYRRVDHGSPLVDLDVVFADDRLVDSVAHPSPAAGNFGRRAGVSDADPVTDLFRAWREELTAAPMPATPDLRRAIETAGGRGGPAKRSLRPALAIAAAIAALLVGTATVGSRQASPDSALWAVTQVLWPDRAQSVASRHTVQDALDQARAALERGQTQQAQLALLRAAMELGRIDEVDGRVDMQARVDEMWKATTPQDVPSSWLTPEMLAGGPDDAVASAVARSAAASASGGPTPVPSAFSASTLPAASAKAAPSAAGTSVPADVSVQPALPEANPSGASPAGADPVLAAGSGPGAVTPPASTSAGSSSQASAPPLAAAPATVPPSPSDPVPTVPAPAAAPPVSPSPAAVDPGVPTTAPALTPPPPAPADPSSAPSSPATTPPAAPPAPPPMPPTGTETSPSQTAGTTATGATNSTPSGQLVSGQQPAADISTAAQAPTT